MIENWDNDVVLCRKIGSEMTNRPVSDAFGGEKTAAASVRRALSLGNEAVRPSTNQTHTSDIYTGEIHSEEKEKEVVDIQLWSIFT